MMKRYVLVACLMMFTGKLFAQGIEFSHGTWKEVLAKAKQEDKLVFVDVYTSWCGPCKKMVAEVFPLKEVGEVFNPNFVNYKIDAEKGEGIEIAKKFGVKSYPTYLFVNGDGELVYRSGGYNLPKIFLNEAAIAIKEKHDPKPLAKWEDEYTAGKRDKDFLKGYIRKRAVVKVPNGPLLEEVFPLLTANDLSDKDFMGSVFAFDPNMTFVPGGKFYGHVVANHAALDQLLGKREGYVLSLMDVGTQQYFNTDIIKNNREQLLPVMLATKRKLMELMKRDEIDVELKGLVMNYYKGTKNAKKLVPAAHDYVNNSLLNLDIQARIAADKAAYQKMREPYLSGKQDSTKVENWASMQRISANQKMVDFSYKLRSAAQAVYALVDDPKILTQAIEWAKMAESYFPHFSTEAVYAGLLMKIGKKTEAAEMMLKASKDGFIQGNDKQKLLLANVEKLKKGEAPEELW
ncbi:thioredoxin family protein [Pedobacter africanus]|uniref:Thioredoxin n=1 Tax=Pedobacter africanus TaxID=151894 RepID=A0A1W1YU87_9SPHI|nr:protein disulfide isomerase family protein [Pedobacter africanus]SMC39729.1 Thioredoxin [Pedobacter africanus]